MRDHKCEHSPKNVSGLVSSSTSCLRRSASLFQVCARSSKTLLSSGLAVRSASFRHSSACLLYSSTACVATAPGSCASRNRRPLICVAVEPPCPNGARAIRQLIDATEEICAMSASNFWQCRALSLCRTEQLCAVGSAHHVRCSKNSWRSQTAFRPTFLIALRCTPVANAQRSLPL